MIFDMTYYQALQKTVDELSEKMGRHTIIGQGRLLNAFPSITHRDYQESLKMLKEILFKP